MDREKTNTGNAMITADDITDITLTQAGYYWEMRYHNGRCVNKRTAS